MSLQKRKKTKEGGWGLKQGYLLGTEPAERAMSVLST